MYITTDSKLYCSVSDQIATVVNICINMYKTCEKLLEKEDIEAAYEIAKKSELSVRKTPCILIREENVGAACQLFTELDSFNQQEWPKVYLKCENLQNTGSFKIRGVATQFAAAKKQFASAGPDTADLQLVTMSAGNYGRSYAYAVKSLGLSATVLMPDTAPENRARMLESFGLQVERMPSSQLMEGVKRHEEAGKLFMHPFDDINLIAGHASLGLEILENVPDVDVVAVCCGGGGLLAGVATAVKLFKPECKVIGVEPETACSMQKSLKEGEAVKMPSARSIAAGLAPPFAGENAFKHVSKFCDGIITVTETEIKDAAKSAYNNGLVVEPSGAAALAAFMTNRICKAEDDQTVVIVLTGGNVSPQELQNLF